LDYTVQHSETLKLSIQLGNDSGNNTGTQRSDDPEPLIINGANAKLGRYPYYAVSQPWGCGGSLVSERAILTAAHCVSAFWDKVEVGLTTWRDKWGQIIPIQKVIPHPKYDSYTFDYDYAIVILRKASKYKPVCIARKKYEKNWAKKRLTVMGFGSTKSNRMNQEGKDHITPTSRLKFTNVNQVSQRSCKDAYPFDPITPQMRCALGPNKKDACQGDSGGPLIKAGRNANGDVLVGVVSWGVGCGTNPGVYSDVAEVSGWIVQMVKRNKAGPMANPKACLKALKAK